MPIINATLSVLGALSIGLEGVPWLEGGAVVVRSDAQWYSSNCATMSNPSACEPLLPAAALDTKSGTDAVGAFTEETLAWSTRKGGSALILTGVRSYAAMPDVKVLTQSFPAGLTPQNKHGLTDEVVTAFPSLQSNHLDLGVLFYEGVQCQNTHFFRCGRNCGLSAQKPQRGR